MKKIALRHAFEALDEYWDQHVLGEANGILIKIAKGVGATGWHSHDDQTRRSSSIEGSSPSRCVEDDR